MRKIEFRQRKFFLFLGIFLLLLLWLTIGRKTEVEVRVDQVNITVWEAKKLLAKTKKEVTLLSPITLKIEHDQDALWVLPFKKQTLKIFDEKGNDQIISLSKPTMAAFLNKLKSRFALNRPPFSAKVFYHDTSLITEEETALMKTPIKKILISTWNVNQAKISFKTASEETLTLWLRPKFHHDGTITFGDTAASFITTVGGSSLYYLKILLSLLTRNLIGTYLVLGLVLLLIKILPIKTLSLPKLKPKIQRVIIFFIPVCFFIAALYVSISPLQKIPHTQDEVAYLFQAKIFSRGRLLAQSLPGNLSRFFDHEFIINNGKWFSSFPPGTSLFLALGAAIKKPYLINPLISSISIFLFILITRKLVSFSLTILATVLLIASPFFLLISASFLSHPSSLLLTLLALNAFMEIRKKPSKKLPWLLIGLSLGFLSLVRPANSVFLSFILLIPLFKLVFKNFRSAAAGGLVVVPFLLINLYYNLSLTGKLSVLPYNLYSSYNKLGFGPRGAEWGGRFALKDALNNLTFNFYSLLDLLFRWPTFLTLSFVPLAFLGKFRKKALFLVTFFISQAALYFFYFSEGTFYGPRFWFEASWILPLVTMMGVATIPEIFSQQKRKAALASYSILIGLLIYGSASTLAVLPQFQGANGVRPVTIPALETPAIVFVPGTGSWQSYGQYFIHQSPFLDDPVIFARDQAIHNLPKDVPPLENKILKEYFPARKFYQLYQGKIEELD